MKITDFLKTKRSKNDLKIALEILLEFKSKESSEEWFHCTFASWSKLEQLEEYLEHLVNSRELKADTIRYMGQT